MLSLISIFPVFLSYYDVKLDVYLFYKKERYIENIGYDISQMITLIVLTERIWELIPERKYKRYAFDFLIISVLSLPAYFLFYSQFINLLFIPLLSLLLYISYLKNIK